MYSKIIFVVFILKYINMKLSCPEFDTSQQKYLKIITNVINDKYF